MYKFKKKIKKKSGCNGVRLTSEIDKYKHYKNNPTWPINNQLVASGVTNPFEISNIRIQIWALQICIVTLCLDLSFLSPPSVCFEHLRSLILSEVTFLLRYTHPFHIFHRISLFSGFFLRFVSLFFDPVIHGVCKQQIHFSHKYTTPMLLAAHQVFWGNSILSKLTFFFPIIFLISSIQNNNRKSILHSFSI